MLASAAIKLVAATHLLWAGLAIGVLLEPAQDLFMIVFLGFLISRLVLMALFGADHNATTLGASPNAATISTRRT